MLGEEELAFGCQLRFGLGGKQGGDLPCVTMAIWGGFFGALAGFDQIVEGLEGCAPGKAEVFGFVR